LYPYKIKEEEEEYPYKIKEEEQHGRVVRASDFKSGDPEFGSHSDH